MSIIELWLTRPDPGVYDPDDDPGNYEGSIVRVGKRVVGHVEEVLEIRPEAIKIKLFIEGDAAPY